MTDGKDKLTEEEYSEIANEHYDFGICKGRQEVAAELKALALQYFDAGKDDLAHLFRELAASIKKRADEQHEALRKKYHYADDLNR